MQGMSQVIDITDDATGEPSRLAKEEIPMYGKASNVLGREMNRILRYLEDF
jgi:hypothetical protein